MKAKILAVLCAVVFTVGTISGCGSSASDTKDTETETEAEAEVTEEATEETTEETSEEIDEEPVSETEAEKAGFTDGEEEKATTEESDASVEEGEDASAETDESESEESGEEDSGSTEEETIVLDTSKELTGIHHATITIEDYGEIDVELDADTAPVTVTNFVKLVQDGFYDGLTFWRIMDGFMIQGGDPNGNGTGGADETIKGEFSNNGVENDISHVRGVISMARSSDPDSASSQFFIVQTDSTFLDGDYAAFGEVTEGMDIVDQICKDAEPTDDNGTIEKDEQPVIESIKIVD